MENKQINLLLKNIANFQFEVQTKKSIFVVNTWVAGLTNFNSPIKRKSQVKKNWIIHFSDFFS